MTTQEFENSTAINKEAQKLYFLFALNEISLFNQRIGLIQDLSNHYTNANNFINELHQKGLKGKYGYDFAYYLVRNPRYATAKDYLQYIEC